MGGRVIRKASFSPLESSTLLGSAPTPRVSLLRVFLRLTTDELLFISSPSVKNTGLLLLLSCSPSLRGSLISALQLWSRWDNEVIQRFLALLRSPFQRCLIAKAGGGATGTEMGQLGWKMAGLHPGLDGSTYGCWKKMAYSKRRSNHQGCLGCSRNRKEIKKNPELIATLAP